MVEVKKLTESLYVAPQLEDGDFAELAKAGFRTIINNRPDGEQAGQLTAEDSRRLAGAQGLTYVHLPVTNAELDVDHGLAQIRALAEHDGPVVAHCRSGTRSTVLWAIGAAASGEMAVHHIVSIAAAAGYDLAGVRALLDEAAK